MRNTSPIPEPARRYHDPFGSSPVSRHRRCSARCVPDSSARETNVVCACRIFPNASFASASPRMRAGSSFGPTITKSLYITSKRAMPKPSSMSFSSSARLWVKTTSTSPLRANFNTWPVPPMLVRILIPLVFSNAGNRNFSRPESSVVVVVPRRSRLSSA